MTFYRKLFYVLIIGWSFVVLPEPVLGKIQLPHLISDGMILQRDAEVTIWGWAEPGEKVTIQFLGETHETVTDAKGEWSISLSPMNAGGPYRMELEGTNRIILENVLIGEIWVSSGQSNMELPMRRVRPLYEEEIARSVNKQIRYFNVPDRYHFQHPKKMLESGSWTEASPGTVPDFSAVAYFFAVELNREYGVPVGIINASLGGSPAQSWISEDALKKTFPEYYREAQKFKDATLINRIQQRDRQRIRNWYALVNKKDRGYQTSEPWYEPGINTDDWSTMEIPGYWAETGLGDINGVVWFRKTVTIPAAMAARPAKLNLGRIVDADSVFINGKFVGNTTYQYPPRWYDVPGNVLKEGKNTIAVRVINERGRGGFVLDKSYRLTVGEKAIDLKGPWKYRLGAQMEPLEPQTFIRWKPVGLFNAMIAPLLNYRMRGVIWYQGESNTGSPEEYKDLFPLLIRNWREKWGQGDFPFLFVQLANFMEAGDTPSESNWAALREAQRKTLSVSNTGMAVTIDIGEWNDIHLLNKKDVGRRLALAAQKVAYHDDVIYSGPMIESMNVEGNKAILKFDHTGSGLVARGDELGGFAIAGEDSHFVWASARIEGDTVVVWSNKVPTPAVVRYGWADNPANANLYNKEGLPASPFTIQE